MRGEDYVSREARDTAARLSPTATPTEVFQEISLAIRRCLHAYRELNEDPDRMHKEWRNGLWTGIVVAVVSNAIVGVAWNVVIK